MKEDITNKISKDQSYRDQALVGWVMDHVEEWEDWRQTEFDARWDEYYRLWRGEWDASDRLYEAERSRLIAPALSQAVESTVSELEEASFGKGLWFDSDSEEDAPLISQLRRDMEEAKVADEISKVYLNGALYGTGLAKVIVDKSTSKTITTKKIEGDLPIYEPAAVEKELIKVKLVAINPKEFVIDPSARSVEEALGCAHVTYRPRHTVTSKQEEGIYKEVDLGSMEPDFGEKRDYLDSSNPEQAVKIVEYYGKVPRDLLPSEEEDTEEVVDILKDEDDEFSPVDYVYEDDDLVEAIVTIANDAVILRAVENVYLMKDRPIIAYQHDTVPDSFWGRGICEKGYNPQKALDAEIRARMDALALASRPMMAVDATRLPRGYKMEVRGGKLLPVNGDPNNMFFQFAFGAGVRPESFHQSGDLERMIQMGTGAMDSAAPISQNPRNNTSSGMSMIQSGMIKRTKRTLQNIEKQFLLPLLSKFLWRYIQFEPRKYPAKDYQFKLLASLGIMAREYETQQLIQMLQLLPPESPATNALVRGIINNMNVQDKDQIIAILDQTAGQPSQKDQAAIQASQAKAGAEQAKAARDMAQAQVLPMQTMVNANRAQTERINALGKLREASLRTAMGNSK